MSEKEHERELELELEMTRLISTMVGKYGPKAAEAICVASENALAALEPLPWEQLQGAEEFLIGIFGVVDRLRSAKLGVRSREQIEDDRVRMEHGVIS